VGDDEPRYALVGTGNARYLAGNAVHLYEVGTQVPHPIMELSIPCRRTDITHPVRRSGQCETRALSNPVKIPSVWVGTQTMRWQLRRAKIEIEIVMVAPDIPKRCTTDPRCIR
jgi:hypothetical protein